MWIIGIVVVIGFLLLVMKSHVEANERKMKEEQEKNERKFNEELIRRRNEREWKALEESGILERYLEEKKIEREEQLREWDEKLARRRRDLAMKKEVG